MGRSAGGFSLLELLVTLFVIVLVTSLVSLNVGTGTRDMELDSSVQQLARGMEYALDEAQFTGTDFGLQLWLRDVRGEWRFGYEWRERREGQWQQVSSGKDVFADVSLPPGVELELTLDGVALEREAMALPAVEAKPQVVLFASGETIPGTLDLREADSGDLLWRLEWDLLGRFQLLHRGEEPDES